MMRTVWCWVGLLAVCAVVMAGAQTTADCTARVDEQGKVVVDPKCAAGAPAQPAAPPASAAKRFPFPGEDAGQAAAPASPDAPAPQDTGASGKGADGSKDSALPVSKRFPFPGETSTPDAAAPGGLKDAGSSGDATSAGSPGESSSSSSSSSSDGGNPSAGPLGEDDDAAAKAAAAKKSARRKMAKSDRQTPSERADEDLQVAGFYQNDGNWKAMYMRAADAVALADDVPEAHCLLAEAARKLSKLDEAQKQYKRCLELDPVPKDKKAAEKALKEMSGK